MTIEQKLLAELLWDGCECPVDDFAWDVLMYYETGYKAETLDDYRSRLRLAGLCAENDHVRNLIYERLSLNPDEELEDFKDTCWRDGYEEGQDFREHVRHDLYLNIHPQRYKTEHETAQITAKILESFDITKAREIIEALPHNKDAPYFKAHLLAVVGFGDE